MYAPLLHVIKSTVAGDNEPHWRIVDRNGNEIGVAAGSNEGEPGVVEEHIAMEL